ncbi:MAG: FAD-dependent monooxygenase [Deltaproteobacteria bacterium]|nr:FAD-dependent monooxygenase [Deltaproteobacteria bacterium]
MLAVELAVGESEAMLPARSAQAIGIEPGHVLGLSIARRALDARRRGRRSLLKFVYHVDLELSASLRSPALDRALRAGRARIVPPPARFALEDVPSEVRARRVAVVGSGPAGLYAAWCLAANGVAVDLIERGPALRERSRAVSRFTRTRELDPEANLLFGEGGAGTYSDGKLYTRTTHALEAPILETLVEAGAPPEIRFDARAHVGTDRLHRILPALRSRLEAMGVRFHFGTRLEGLVLAQSGETASPRHVRALRTTQGEIPCDAVFLALGHSARDTIAALAAEGLAVEAKPFQIGLRIEHPQALVDAGRYGEARDPARLGHAYYALVAKPRSEGALGVHSFCMCPGGQVVAAVAQPGLLCTNGMSNSRHSSPFANSGLVVTLGPKEYGGDVFDGWRLQERLEAAFFTAGGGDYHVPAQRVPDFLAGRESASLPRGSCKLGQTPARIDALLPETMTAALRDAIRRFDGEIPGYAGEEGLLVGIESRSSGPLRMTRDPVARHSLAFENVYPVGEGAGHAGGIMSAAIDGARSAWAFLGRPD